MSLLDRTEDPHDRRPYYCTWSRATAFYSGVVTGEIVGLLILLITRTDIIWMVGLFIGSMVFFAICAGYYDLMKRGEPVKEEKEVSDASCHDNLP